MGDKTGSAAYCIVRDEGTETQYERVISGMDRRGRHYEQLLSMLRYDWPDAFEMVKRVIAYISDAVLVEKEPLIYQVLSKALDGYSHYLYYNQEHKFEDPRRLGVFLEEIINASTRLVELEIQSGDSIWSLETGVPLREWLNECVVEPKVLCRPHKDEYAVRLALYRQLALEPIQTVLKRSSYEEAVVGGCLAACS